VVGRCPPVVYKRITLKRIRKQGHRRCSTSIHLTWPLQHGVVEFITNLWGVGVFAIFLKLTCVLLDAYLQLSPQEKLVCGGGGGLEDAVCVCTTLLHIVFFLNSPLTPIDILQFLLKLLPPCLLAGRPCTCVCHLLAHH
jgi:hypothetical protein